MNDAKHSNKAPSEPQSRQEIREQRREERRAGRGGGAWIMGAILIALGILFLAQNLGSFTFPFQNWWALFILIPALGALGNAYRAYRNSGNQVTHSVRNSLFGGGILLIITAAFLFNLNWTYLGPVLIILVGLGMIVNNALLKD